MSCPYCDAGCKEKELVNDEMRHHLQTEMFSHSTLQVQWMNNLTNEMAALKNDNVQMKEEIKVKKMLLKIGIKYIFRSILALQWISCFLWKSN